MRDPLRTGGIAGLLTHAARARTARGRRPQWLASFVLGSKAWHCASSLLSPHWSGFPYGLFCLVQPAFLDGAAGVVATTPTGTTELRAMYGGLQAGIGALMVLALVRPNLVEGALLALACLAGGLGFARLVGAVADGSFSTYTLSALFFEFALLSACVFFLRARPSPQPT